MSNPLQLHGNGRRTILKKIIRYGELSDTHFLELEANFKYLHFQNFKKRENNLFIKPRLSDVFLGQDVWQYYTNLTQTNLMNKPDWLIEDKAIEVFNIPDVSPQSLNSLLQTFESEESSKFNKYYLYNLVSARGENCDGNYKTAQICGMTKIDFDEYDECLTLPAKSATSASKNFSPAAAVFCLFSIVSLFTELLSGQ